MAGRGAAGGVLQGYFVNQLSRFLLSVAGANRAVLEHAPRDHVKQTALGGTLLTTAALAAVASALALWMALDVPVWGAVAGGLVWGVAILNLDRWLVVSTPRQRTRMGTLSMALPRVLLALVIGLVISTPLTLQIFKAEIDAELVRLHQAELESFERTLLADERFTDLPDWKAQVVDLESALVAGVPADIVSANPEVAALSAQLALVETAYNAAEQEVACERDGTCGSGVVGAGPAFKEKKDRRDRLAGERSFLQAQVASMSQQVRSTAEAAFAQQTIDQTARLEGLRAQVADAEEKRAAVVAAGDSTVENDDGLLARLEALESLTHDNSMLRTAHLTLFLFLTAIECLPIFFKTLLSLSKPTLYEQLLLLEDTRSEERARLRLQTEHEEALAVAEAALEAAQARSATQLDAEIRTAQVVLDAQVSLANQAVDKWKARQSALIDEELESLVIGPGQMLPADLGAAVVTAATVLPEHRVEPEMSAPPEKLAPLADLDAPQAPPPVTVSPAATGQTPVLVGTVPPPRQGASGTPGQLTAPSDATVGFVGAPTRDASFVPAPNGGLPETTAERIARLRERVSGN